jgi:hypothetical protein
MLRATVKFLLLTEAFAVATFAFGWWAVPLLAFAWAAFVDTRRPVMFATMCATSAWIAVLLLNAARGPLDIVAARFGGVLGFPSVALIAATIIYAALLSWSASFVGAAIRKSLFRKPAEVEEPEPAPQHRAGAREVAVADA